MPSQCSQPERLADLLPDALAALAALADLLAEYPAKPLAIRPDDSRPQAIELSIVELVLAASEVSEDAFEIDDGIAQLIQSGAVRILPRAHDPMQQSAETPPLPPSHPLPR